MRHHFSCLWMTLVVSIWVEQLWVFAFLTIAPKGNWTLDQSHMTWTQVFQSSRPFDQSHFDISQPLCKYIPMIQVTLHNFNKDNANKDWQISDFCLLPLG